jgi:hypothetical protein
VRLERFGRVGQWRIPGRRLVGLLTAYAVRVAEPLRLVDLGTSRPCSRSLVPGTARLERFGRVGQWRVPGRSFSLGCGWHTLCGFAEPSPPGCLSECSDQAPGTQVPKPPRCTTPAANRSLCSCPDFSITEYVIPIRGRGWVCSSRYLVDSGRSNSVSSEVQIFLPHSEVPASFRGIHAGPGHP